MNDDNETVLAPEANTNMTSRVGTLMRSREDLIEVLGAPHMDDGDCEKITARWVLMTPAGVATIYDYWWNGLNEWSIGGHNYEVVDHVETFLIRLGLDNPKVIVG